MTTQPKAPEHPLAAQALSLLETILEDMAQRALQRVMPEAKQEPLWIDAKEAAELLGAGYTARRVKELGHMKQVVMDRREPGLSNSPWIFERRSIIAYSSRRVWQIEQGEA